MWTLDEVFGEGGLRRWVFWVGGLWHLEEEVLDRVLLHSREWNWLHKLGAYTTLSFGYLTWILHGFYTF